MSVMKGTEMAVAEFELIGLVEFGKAGSALLSRAVVFCAPAREMDCGGGGCPGRARMPLRLTNEEAGR